MLAAAAHFVEDAFNVDAVVPFSIRASLRICQEALGKHVGFVLRRWPSFQLPAIRLQNTLQTFFVCCVKTDK